MRTAKILRNSLVCATLTLAFGCTSGRPAYNPYQQYPPYPQQYGQQPIQAYPYLQPGQIQPSPQVGTPPAGGPAPVYPIPAGYNQPGYPQPGQQMPQYYAPPQGQAPGPFIGR